MPQRTKKTKKFKKHFEKHEVRANRRVHALALHARAISRFKKGLDFSADHDIIDQNDALKRAINYKRKLWKAEKALAAKTRLAEKDKAKERAITLAKKKDPSIDLKFLETALKMVKQAAKKPPSSSSSPSTFLSYSTTYTTLEPSPTSHRRPRREKKRAFKTKRELADKLKYGKFVR